MPSDVDKFILNDYSLKMTSPSFTYVFPNLFKRMLVEKNEKRIWCTSNLDVITFKRGSPGKTFERAVCSHVWLIVLTTLLTRGNVISHLMCSPSSRSFQRTWSDRNDSSSSKHSILVYWGFILATFRRRQFRLRFVRKWLLNCHLILWFFFTFGRAVPQFKSPKAVSFDKLGSLNNLLLFPIIFSSTPKMHNEIYCLNSPKLSCIMAVLMPILRSYKWRVVHESL